MYDFRYFRLVQFAAVLALLSTGGCTYFSKDIQWEEYLGGPDRSHYSELDQISKENVHLLSPVWEYHLKDSGQLQANPITVNGVLYGMSATAQPFALDAATGKEIWAKNSDFKDEFSTSRGLTYWEEGEDKRILYSSGEWLYAVRADSGEAIEEFGVKGSVSLKSGLGASAVNKMVLSNTPGTRYKNLIIMPTRVSEGIDAAPGYIQAFDIRTGKLEWVFHTIPLPGEEGHDTWPSDSYKNINIGGANNWAGMALDQERGIVYVPTGSAAYDFYGADRHGSNLFANTLLALDAATGKKLWHFQLVHHDILDRDPPAPPNLLTVTHQGKKIAAVAQVTKQGLVFLFDRITGTPLFDIEERPVPVSDIPGEQSWPTQPFPIKPRPFARQLLTEEEISPFADNREELLQLLRETRMEGPFTPLSEQGSFVFPGLDGGAEWGGAAVDPEGILYINSSEMAWIIGLGPSASEKELGLMGEGKRVYVKHCVACHGNDRKGNPESGYPSLVRVGDKFDRADLETVITKGRRMMPAFTSLAPEEMEILLDFLMGEEEDLQLSKEPGLSGGEVNGQVTSYSINRFGKFLDSKNYPAISPPWGTLNAIDMNTGQYLWTVPYGEYPELTKKGIPITGSESYGGPIVTKSGLIFIAGTKDRKLRAIDRKSGETLWETILPAAGFATPSTYEVKGKQYVVIACGGGKLGAAVGNSYIAFALP